MLGPVEIPAPHAEAGEVRVRVRAAAVNPVDAIIRSGQFAGNDKAILDPVVPGMDVAGTLDEIGPFQPAGFDLQVGDDVVGFVVPQGSHGGYSEYLVLPTESVTRKPSSVSFEKAASFLSNALTAQLTLESFALPAESALAVTGATGAVGGYLVQLASQEGHSVIAAARPDDEALVRSLGADVVLDRDGDFIAGVLEATRGHGADALADAAILTNKVIGAVRDYGQVAFYLPTDIRPGRGIRVFQSYVMRENKRHDAIEFLARKVQDGQLAIRVAGVFPADDVQAAHARLEQGHLRGRLILRF